MIRLVPCARNQLLGLFRPAILAAFVLFLAALLAGHFASRQTGIDWTPCLLKKTTGQPCFLCGGTRSALSFARGDVTQSLSWNPLAFLLFVGVLLQVVLTVGFRRWVVFQGWARTRTGLWTIAIGLVIANWIYLIAAGR